MVVAPSSAHTHSLVPRGSSPTSSALALAAVSGLPPTPAHLGERAASVSQALACADEAEKLAQNRAHAAHRLATQVRCHRPKLPASHRMLPAAVQYAPSSLPQHARWHVHGVRRLWRGCPWFPPSFTRVLGEVALGFRHLSHVPWVLHICVERQAGHAVNGVPVVRKPHFKVRTGSPQNPCGRHLPARSINNQCRCVPINIRCGYSTASSTAGRSSGRWTRAAGRTGWGPSTRPTGSRPAAAFSAGAAAPTAARAASGEIRETRVLFNNSRFARALSVGGASLSPLLFLNLARCQPARELTAHGSCACVVMSVAWLIMLTNKVRGGVVWRERARVRRARGGARQPPARASQGALRQWTQGRLRRREVSECVSSRAKLSVFSSRVSMMPRCLSALALLLLGGLGRGLALFHLFVALRQARPRSVTLARLHGPYYRYPYVSEASGAIVHHQQPPSPVAPVAAASSAAAGTPAVVAAPAAPERLPTAKGKGAAAREGPVAYKGEYVGGRRGGFGCR